MATYNGEKYLYEQIESILNQSYKNWILLIRDDKSEDSTVSIIEEYEKKDSRIRLLRDRKGNMGFVKNFEELLKNSQEEFIMFSDQDDYWEKDKIKNYIEILQKDEKLSQIPLLIHSNSFICDKELKIVKEKFVDSSIASEKNGNSYFFSYVVQGSTVMINRKLKEICIPFLSSVTLHDRYFHLISEFFGKRIFIDKSLMKYRQHMNNEIGARRNILQKILKKRYFDTKDRDLIIELKEKYAEIIKKEKIKEIDAYLEVTNIQKNRFTRFFLSLDFKMNLKKRIFLLLKG
jgi:glycosyltransferase, family 2